MPFIRAILFLFQRVYWWRSDTRPYPFEPDKRPNRFVYAGGALAGKVYSTFQRRREWLRVIYRNQQRRRSEYTIPVQIVRHSWSTVTVLAFVFFGTLSGD